MRPQCCLFILKFASVYISLDTNTNNFIWDIGLNSTKQPQLLSFYALHVFSSSPSSWAVLCFTMCFNNNEVQEKVHAPENFCDVPMSKCGRERDAVGVILLQKKKKCVTLLAKKKLCYPHRKCHLLITTASKREYLR